MVLEAVEVVERRATRRVVAARTNSIGVEVPLQGHGTHGETGGLGRAMQIAPRSLNGRGIVSKTTLFFFSPLL
jgi:hypothetical protein